MILNTTPFLSRPTNATLTSDSRTPQPPTQHEKLMKQTEKWVSLAFFEPMLKQMRQDPFKSDLLDGGQGGQAFTAMYDERLSERMSAGPANGLVKSIVNRIEAKRAYSKQQTAFDKDQIKKDGEQQDAQSADGGRSATVQSARTAPLITGAGHAPAY